MKDKLAARVGQSDVLVEEQGRVLRSAGAVGGITLLSRVAGYLRDLVIARMIGTTPIADAWFSAFRLPNTLRRVVGEGNVAAAFVPVFSEEGDRRDERSLWALADSFHAGIAWTAGLMTLAGIAAAPWLVRWILVPGWNLRGGGAPVDLTIGLTRATFPYLFFIAMAAALMAILNARDRFLLPASTPILFNVTIIAAALGLSRIVRPVYAIAIGAVAGGVIQWLMQVPVAARMGMRFRPIPRPSDPALRTAGRLMLPGLFGVGITQINILVGQILASFLAYGSISSLYYASRINELTLGVYAISVATVVLPLMSRQAARGADRQLVESANFALRQVTAITLPAATGLIILRHEIVSTLYRYGTFDENSAAMTASALWAYALGLVAYAAVRLLAPTFYALKDTVTPVIAAGLAMVVNIAGCLILTRFLAHAGIALANSIAAAVNGAVLLWLLRRRLGGIGGWRLAAAVARIATATAAMAAVVIGVRSVLFGTPAGTIALRAGNLAVLIAVGVAAYWLALVLLRAPELGELRSILDRTGDGAAADTGAGEGQGS